MIIAILNRFSVSVLALFLLYSNLAQAEQKVHYAGISFLGSYQYIEQNYPNARLINQSESESGPGQLEKALISQIQQQMPSQFNLSFDFANSNKGDSTVVALAIDREYLSEESLAGVTKLIAEVSGQLLFIDFNTMTLVANYPIAASKNHVLKGKTNKASQVEQLFRDVYLGNKRDKGLLEIAASKLAGIKLSNKKDIRFQVSQVVIDERAAVSIDMKPAVFQQFMGQSFSAKLANEHDVAVLPFVKGYAIGGKMAGRFANGDVFNIQLPKPDYEFSITVTNLLKKESNNKNLYAARMKLALTEPLLNKIYLDEDFQYAVYKLIAKSYESIDDWGAYEDALVSLINELVEQLARPNKKWVKSHARSIESYKKLKANKELFNVKS